jgi:hypothetical protein
MKTSIDILFSMNINMLNNQNLGDQVLDKSINGTNSFFEDAVEI